LARELGEQREQASSQLAFEEAATIHSKIEKLKHLLSQLPEIVQPLGTLRAIIVQPGAETGSVSLFYFSNGILHGPATFGVLRPASSTNAQSADGEKTALPALPKHISMESRVQELIPQISGPRAGSVVEITEQLAILKRWYYRSHRIGEIFFPDKNGLWPLRRMVRGIGRVYNGDNPAESTIFSATRTSLPPS
jgi:hypothetical protein